MIGSVLACVCVCVCSCEPGLNSAVCDTESVRPCNVETEMTYRRANKINNIISLFKVLTCSIGKVTLHDFCCH